MKLRNVIIATLAFSGHLAGAEGSAEAEAQPRAAVEQSAVEQPAEKAATEKQIKTLETDVTPSLQSKLDALMSFDAGPLETSRQEVASAH